MFDDISECLAGSEQPFLASRVLVPPRQVLEVCRLLSANQIPYSVEGALAFHDDDQRSEALVVRQGAD